MARINFPNNPTDETVFTSGGATYRYVLSKGYWTAITTSSNSGNAGGLLTTVYATTADLPLVGNDIGDQGYVSGNNRLYFWNGSGWYSIAIINDFPNITSVQDAGANVTPFTLDTTGTPTIITVTASDPEDLPLTYSYSLTAGSLTNGGGTTATVVQGTGANINQFTITPSTTVGFAGTFELTFTTSDGINTATSPNIFTLTF